MRMRKSGPSYGGFNGNKGGEYRPGSAQVGLNRPIVSNLYLVTEFLDPWNQKCSQMNIE